MVETKESEIIPTEDNINTCSKKEKYCAYLIVAFFIGWIAAVIYVGQLAPSEFSNS